MSSDVARLEHLLEVYRGLVEVSALINGITDSSELLPAILDVARRVMNAEAASIFLLNDAGELELANTSSGTAAGLKITVPKGRGVSGWVLEHGKPLLIADAYADARFYSEIDRQTGFHTRSILCIPLERSGKKIGVLQVLNPHDRAAFDDTDLEAFAAYGTLAATAIDKMRTLERQRTQERAEHELRFAREIQRSFLPQSLPHIGRLEFAATYRPAFNVGGDFYDIVALGPDEVYFVIGDVAGKGVPAALLMAQTLSILRLILTPGISPVTATARWNERLNGHTIRGMFVTALLGRVVCSTREIELCSAGHCHPFHVRHDGEARQVPLGGSPPLGLLPELPARSHVLKLDPGDWLVLCTDGLLECFDENDVPLDPQGVTNLLSQRHHGAAELVATLSAGEVRHRGRAEPHDDLTILALGFQ